MVGRTISHYRIVAHLGAGGMGEVYRATDTRLGRSDQRFSGFAHSLGLDATAVREVA